MEGTVTLSLKDYEELKEQIEIKEQYRRLACEHIKLLEEIEIFLNTENIKTGLLEDISDVLDNWYG